MVLLNTESFDGKTISGNDIDQLLTVCICVCVRFFPLFCSFVLLIDVFRAMKPQRRKKRKSMDHIIYNLAGIVYRKCTEKCIERRRVFRFDFESIVKWHICCLFRRTAQSGLVISLTRIIQHA